MFWFVLKAEIEKVNGFFASKEEEANRQFAAVGLEHELSNHNTTGASGSGSGQAMPQPDALSTDRLVFAKLLIEQHPRALAERLLPPALFQSASSVPWSALPSARVALLTSFLSLCALLDQLRKFVVINYVVVLKVLKKYDDFTIRSAKDELSRELSDEPFATSARLASLLQRAESITFRLLPPTEGQRQHSSALRPTPHTPSTDTSTDTTSAAAANNEQTGHSSSSPELSSTSMSTSTSTSATAASSLCPICHLSLANPVQLQCGHRCCFNCLASHTVARSFSCPVCAKQQDFDSLDLGCGVRTD